MRYGKAQLQLVRPPPHPLSSSNPTLPELPVPRAAVPLSRHKRERVKSAASHASVAAMLLRNIYASPASKPATTQRQAQQQAPPRLQAPIPSARSRRPEIPQRPSHRRRNSQGRARL